MLFAALLLAGGTPDFLATGEAAEAEQEHTSSAGREASKGHAHVPVPSVDDMLTKSPDEIFANSEQELDRLEAEHPHQSLSVDAMVRKGLTGGRSITIPPVDMTPVNAERSVVAAERAQQAQAIEVPHGGWPLGTLLASGMAGVLLGGLAMLGIRRR